MDGMEKVGVECQVGVAEGRDGRLRDGGLRAEPRNLVTDRRVGRDRTCAAQELGWYSQAYAQTPGRVSAAAWGRGEQAVKERQAE